MRAADACPDAETILHWTAGRLGDTARADEIEAHLAACARCGVDLDVALGASAWVAEHNLVDASPGDVGHRSPGVGRARQEARGIFDAAEETWSDRLLDHAMRREASFLYEVASLAAWYSDEKPGSVRRFAERMRPLLQDLPGTFLASQVGAAAAALLHLADGVAARTEGDHVGALLCYQRGEEHIGVRALSHEYARLNVARATSLRLLNRLDEAGQCLLLARQVFARLGDELGEAKVLLELANVSYQGNDLRAALPRARGAVRIFLRRGEDAQAAIATIALLGILMGLRRLRAARRVVDALLRHDYIRGNPFQLARVLWKEGRLRAMEGDLHEAAKLLEQAAVLLADAGAVRGAACALLDVAHVAGELGDVGRQATAARDSLALLSRLTAQQVPVALALEQLRHAVAAGVGVAEVVNRLREQLRTT